MTICVTGQMAAGKNMVCGIFEVLGWKSIDADIVVHDVVKKLTPEIVAMFSEDAQAAKITLTNDDGSLNRRAVGELIFKNPELLSRQESLVYPEVISHIKNFCAGTSVANESVSSMGTVATTVATENTIINATVLYKTPPLMELCDAVVFVTAPLLLRLYRAYNRDKISLSAILARFKSQKGLLHEYKVAAKNIAATRNILVECIPVHVVQNCGSVKMLENKIKKLSEKILDNEAISRN